MRSSKSEESFPLLLLFLEDTRNLPKRKDGIFFEKNRYSRISEGASNVFTQWPSHVSLCWLSTFVFVLFFLMILLVLLATSIHPKLALPHCTPYQLNESNIKIFLVHCDSKWSASELQGVEEIIHNYPGITVDVIILTNGTHNETHRSIKKSVKRKQFGRTLEELDINVGKKEVVKKLKHNELLLAKPNISKTEPARTFDVLLKRHHNIETHNETMEHFFEFTPLHTAWKRMNLNMLEFAARVVMLWEYGGISFKLPKIDTMKKEAQKVKVYGAMERQRMAYEDTWRIEALLKSNLTSFNNLPNGVVNIDDGGLHMETKTPCHAYFGEMMMNCRSANLNTTVDDIVVTTLKTFCLSGAVSDDYCYNLAAI